MSLLKQLKQPASTKEKVKNNEGLGNLEKNIWFILINRSF